MVRGSPAAHRRKTSHDSGRRSGCRIEYQPPTSGLAVDDRKTESGCPAGYASRNSPRCDNRSGRRTLRPRERRPLRHASRQLRFRDRRYRFSRLQSASHTEMRIARRRKPGSDILLHGGGLADRSDKDTHRAVPQNRRRRPGKSPSQQVQKIRHSPSRASLRVFGRTSVTSVRSRQRQHNAGCMRIRNGSRFACGAGGGRR